ncbi:hypothetical protein [Sandarakinorhabdus sp.]|uniref:hypothetical protein n=1 Tax=Sandarakinorhabdus sp. TaxID=1916663 RepID=UPI00286D953D|nr:hypothetical protein [Sandarakinorhabdus sp.]
MKIIQYLRGTLVNGSHVDEGEIHTVGEDLDLETATFLVRQGCADDITEQLPEGTETVVIASLTVPQLKEMAAAEGIELGEAAKKAEIVELIEKHLAAKANAA